MNFLATVLLAVVRPLLGLVLWIWRPFGPPAQLQPGHAPRRILVVGGAGPMGLPNALALAELGHEVIVCDVDIDRISSLRRGVVPFREPGLEAAVRRHLATRCLLFTTSITECIAPAEILLLCVGTPTARDGSGSADLSAFWTAMEGILEAFGDSRRDGDCSRKIIVIRSTVPVGTADELRHRIRARGMTGLVVVSSPEFLAEGTALKDSVAPHKLVVGGEDQSAIEELIALHGRHVQHERVVRCSSAEAELIKLANNAMLAIRLEAVNEFGNIAAAFGVDIDVVARALGLDDRIGPRFLAAGPGWGGSCFGKDVASLRSQAGRAGIEVPVIAASLRGNDRQQHLLGRILCERFRGDLKGCVIAVAGLAFKPGTGDIRGSSSLVLIDDLLVAGATLRVFDPVSSVLDQVERQFAGGAVERIDDQNALARGADVLCVMHPDLATHFPLGSLQASMRSPILVDPWRQYDPSAVRAGGFEYWPIGRPAFANSHREVLPSVG